MAQKSDIEGLSEGLKVIYVALDGEPSKVLYAAWDKQRFCNLTEADRSLAHRIVETRVIDVRSLRAQALRRLDGVDRLVLNLPDWIEEGQTRSPKPKGPNLI